MPSSCELPSKTSVNTWTLCCYEPRDGKKIAGRVEAERCELPARPAFPLSGTERVLVDRTSGSGLVPKPGGCLSAGGGGRAGGFGLDVGCDVCRLRLRDCSDLLNPPDQRFEGTETSFRLGGLGGVPEFRRCSSVQGVT